MSANSPIANPSRYTSRIDALSKVGITIDKGVAQAKRDALTFSDKYSGDFSTVSQLKGSLESFSDSWTRTLQQTRDAASSLAGWFNRFDQVFLSMINDIGSDGDAQDVVAEYESFKAEPAPTSKYPELDSAPGVKTALNDLEKLVTDEIDRIVQTLKGGSGWRPAVEDLKKNIPAIQSGIGSIRQSLNNYAVKLE